MTADTDLARLCEQILSDFIADPARNTMGPGTTEPAWEGFLLAFAAGDDPLFDELKVARRPAALDAGRGLRGGARRWRSRQTILAPDPASPARLRRPARSLPPTSPSSAGPSARPRPRKLPTAARPACRRSPGHVRASSGRRGTPGCTSSWSRRLRARGYQAVAPSMSPAWAEAGRFTNGWSSTWSERHVAYVAGLGTLSLSGGLITERGQALRLGSVIVKAAIPATPRAYDGPFAYCQHYTDDGCDECAQRCPAGSINVQGRDKQACAYQLKPRSEEYVRTHYGFEGYGCGLCQTAVPCESAIPEGLRPPAGS